MTISVLTPAYKAEAFIVRAVRSVLAQTYRDWEMIIISDDGQDYRRVLHEQGIQDERLRFASTNAIGKGPSKARNIGLDLANYALISCLDADDEYAANFLEHVLPAVQDHGAVSTYFRFIDESTGKDLPNDPILTTDTVLTKEQFFRYRFACANIIFDKRRTRAAWPEGIHYGEDLLFWFLLLDDIPAIAYKALPCYHYYERRGSLSDVPEGDTRALYEYRAKLLHLFETGVPPIRNYENRMFFKRWLHVTNALEEKFNFVMADPDVYRAEFNKLMYTITEGGN